MLFYRSTQHRKSGQEVFAPYPLSLNPYGSRLLAVFFGNANVPNQFFYLVIYPYIPCKIIFLLGIMGIKIVIITEMTSKL